jgi:hypothetical protein
MMFDKQMGRKDFGSSFLGLFNLGMKMALEVHHILGT